MFLFHELPWDIKIIILSLLPLSQIKKISPIISFNTIYYTIKYKYSDLNEIKITGLYNNFRSNCFICNKYLYIHYNLILCKNCSINNKYDNHYPEICHKCSILKLSRGEVRLDRCPLCKQYSTQLGITSYS